MTGLSECVEVVLLPADWPRIRSLCGDSMTLIHSHNTTQSQRRVFSNIMAISHDIQSRSQALSLILDELQLLSQWAAVSLSVYDPLTRKHHSVASAGYSKDTVSYLDNSYTAIDPAYRWILRTGQNYFNWSSTEFDYSKTISARNWWIPGGYKGGSTSYLTSRDARYIGNLHTSTEDIHYPTFSTLEFINDISPLIASLIDVWQEPRSILRNTALTEPPVFVDFKGIMHDIPGYDPCRNPQLRNLIALAIKKEHSSIGYDILGQKLPSVCWSGTQDKVFRLEFKRCRRGWLVIYNTHEFPYKLTFRQAEVCSLSAMGLTRERIAGVLCISTRTVDRHIENIFDKMLVKNRIELACVSVSAGLIRLEDFTHLHMDRAIQPPGCKR